jgi:hypothetical protein
LAGEFWPGISARPGSAAELQRAIGAAGQQHAGRAGTAPGRRPA